MPNKTAPDLNRACCTALRQTDLNPFRSAPPSRLPYAHDVPSPPSSASSIRKKLCADSGAASAPRKSTFPSPSKRLRAEQAKSMLSWPHGSRLQARYGCHIRPAFRAYP
ncbi:hypothetical protein EJ06DRAFT_532389 [Trichodelitschia bisporula]|uniref:Uncharacterized protein n=1 Tax=Trichodelitschia bisporula TaxID=703511 RepID=A0A6G1HQ29_9PEZI|nr:hypothetical protein EJ06DRAFT_532389 [Trichodelitschia bisporula]